MMSTRVARLLAFAVVAAGLGGAWPAAAQEWRIYLFGKTEPIVADQYVEETPWVFFRDDQSIYIFAVGCNRIERVERAGRPIPLPDCPVEKLPTTMPRVYVAIMDLEAKRLDDSIARLTQQTRAYAEAAIGGAVAARGQALGAGGARAADVSALARNLEGIAFLASQISDTLFEIRLIDQRVGKLLDAARSFPAGERQRYFFAPR